MGNRNGLLEKKLIFSRSEVSDEPQRGPLRKKSIFRRFVRCSPSFGGWRGTKAQGIAMRFGILICLEENIVSTEEQAQSVKCFLGTLQAGAAGQSAGVAACLTGGPPR